MRDSAYLSENVSPIHAHDLALVRHFTSYLSGQAELANGGMVLAIESANNRPSSPALDFCYERDAALKRLEPLEAELSNTTQRRRKERLRSELEEQRATAEWDAHRKIDDRVLKAMDGVEAWKIKGLSREEARGIMEYYARSGMMRQAVDNRLVGEKWTLSGNGIIGELERGTVMMRI